MPIRPPPQERTGSARSRTTSWYSSSAASAPAAPPGPASSPAAGAASGPSSQRSLSSTPQIPARSAAPSRATRRPSCAFASGPGTRPRTPCRPGSPSPRATSPAASSFTTKFCGRGAPRKAMRRRPRRGAPRKAMRRRPRRGRPAFELPCLERATYVSLDLGFLGLAVPSAGVFARLTVLYLSSVRFHGPVLLGDAVSWPRCPCLQKLTVLDTRGLDNLAIHSDSLLEVELTHLRSLRQLSIVAPVLKELKVERCCFYNWSQPVASITTPQLAILTWMDRLLRRFKVVEGLTINLAYVRNMDDCYYGMEDMTMLPETRVLHLNVLANRHAFGASAFHVLRMCSNIRKLMLSFVPPTEVEAQNTCPPGCICGEHQNWRTEHLLLNRLKEVEITRMRGSEHEVTFVKQLFNWSTSLQKMRVVFDKSVTENVSKELSQVLRSFGRPGIHMEVRTYMEDMLKSALLSGGRDNLV